MILCEVSQSGLIPGQVSHDGHPRLWIKDQEWDGSSQRVVMCSDHLTTIINIVIVIAIATEKKRSKRS